MDEPGHYWKPRPLLGHTGAKSFKGFQDLGFGALGVEGLAFWLAVEGVNVGVC